MADSMDSELESWNRVVAWKLLVTRTLLQSSLRATLEATRASATSSFVTWISATSIYA
jgi:hypothetical protein